MKTINRRFQKHPLWTAFSKTSVFGAQKRRLRVEGRLKRGKKISKISGCVWKEPKSVFSLNVSLKKKNLASPSSVGSLLSLLPAARGVRAPQAAEAGVIRGGCICRLQVLRVLF